MLYPKIFEQLNPFGKRISAMVLIAVSHSAKIFLKLIDKGLNPKINITDRKNWLHIYCHMLTNYIPKEMYVLERFCTVPPTHKSISPQAPCQLPGLY